MIPEKTILIVTTVIGRLRNRAAGKRTGLNLLVERLPINNRKGGGEKSESSAEVN